MKTFIKRLQVEVFRIPLEGIGNDFEDWAAEHELEWDGEENGSVTLYNDTYAVPVGLGEWVVIGPDKLVRGFSQEEFEQFYEQES